MSKKIISVITCIIILVIGWQAASNLGWFGLGSSKAIENAEARVNQLVYQVLGRPAKNFSSDIIYDENDKRLIVVKYSTSDDSNWGGSCCVYLEGNSVLGNTKSMPPEYNYDIESMKALFAIP